MSTAPISEFPNLTVHDVIFITVAPDPVHIRKDQSPVKGVFGVEVIGNTVLSFPMPALGANTRPFQNEIANVPLPYVEQTPPMVGGFGTATGNASSTHRIAIRPVLVEDENLVGIRVHVL